MQLPFMIMATGVGDQRLSESGSGSGSGSGGGSGSGPHSSQYCEQLSQTTSRMLYSEIAIAAVILILLSFMYRRVRLCKRVLWGVPGLVVPVNLLSPTRFRIVYAFIFGAISSTLLSLILSGFTKIDTDVRYLDIVLNTIVSPAIVIFLFLLLYFPLFACVETPFPLVGHIIGLLYTCILVAVQVTRSSLQYVGCTGYQPDIAAIIAVGNLPIYVCYLVILVWYLCHAVMDIVDFYRTVTTAYGHITTEQTLYLQKGESRYYFKYVSSLLKRPHDQGESWTRRWISSIYHLFSLNKGLRLPLKFLGVLTVMLILLYQLSFELFTIAATEGGKLANIWEENGRAFVSSLTGLNTTSSTVEKAYNQVLSLLRGITALWALASVVSFVICLILLIHMVFSVRKQLQTAVQGKFHVLVPSLQSPTRRLAASLKYAGFQIGFFVWAWLIYWFVAVLFGIAGIVLYYLYKFFAATALYYTAYILFPVVWSFVVYYVQVLLCKLVFIRKGGGKFINITNRRLWNWFEYIFFFYNTIIGFVAAIFRVLISVLFSLLLLFRLDTVILMKGFEFGDTGHNAFIGFLYLEYTYNNAVVNMFVKLLMDGDSTQRGKISEHVQVEVEEEIAALPNELSRRKQARNRWLVAYTLLRNPCLQELTASRIRERREQEMVHAGMNHEEEES